MLAASGRILQQEMFGQVGDLENVPDSNESLVVPTYTFDLEVPALAPASAPIVQQLLAPISAPQATESEFLQVVSGRRLKQVITQHSSHVAILLQLLVSGFSTRLQTRKAQKAAPYSVVEQVLANVPSLSASPESLAPLAALAASGSPAVLETGRTQARSLLVTSVCSIESLVAAVW